MFAAATKAAEITADTRLCNPELMSPWAALPGVRPHLCSALHPLLLGFLFQLLVGDLAALLLAFAKASDKVSAGSQQQHAGARQSVSSSGSGSSYCGGRASKWQANKANCAPWVGPHSLVPLRIKNNLQSLGLLLGLFDVVDCPPLLPKVVRFVCECIVVLVQRRLHDCCSLYSPPPGYHQLTGEQLWQQSVRGHKGFVLLLLLLLLCGNGLLVLPVLLLAKENGGACEGHAGHHGENERRHVAVVQGAESKLKRQARHNMLR